MCVCVFETRDCVRLNLKDTSCPPTLLLIHTNLLAPTRSIFVGANSEMSSKIMTDIQLYKE